jgi:nucleotide-binding universal stress UspA family protein
MAGSRPCNRSCCRSKVDVEAAIRFLQLKPFHDPVKLTLLTVVPTTEPPGPDGAAAAPAEMLEKHNDFIEGVATRLRAIGYQAHGVARHGTPSATILQEATTRCSDLILMGTRGRQGITRFVLGSVSHEVVHKMPCPVLAFRGGTDREKQAMPSVNVYASNSTTSG